MKITIYKILPVLKGANDYLISPKFISLPSHLSIEDANRIIKINAGDVYQHGIRSVEPVIVQDNDFIRYAKSDIKKLEEEIKKKQELKETLQELLKQSV